MRQALALGGIQCGKGQTEIDDLQIFLSVQQNVLRFEVPMDHAIGMGGHEALAHLRRHPQEFGEGKRPLLDPRSQILSLDVLACDIEAAVQLLQGIDGRDGGMIQGSGDLGLAAEPPALFEVAAHEGRDGLESHGTVQPRVDGTVDDAHAAPSHLAENPVPAQGVPFRQETGSRFHGGWLKQLPVEEGGFSIMVGQKRQDLAGQLRVGGTFPPHKVLTRFRIVFQGRLRRSP